MNCQFCGKWGPDASHFKTFGSRTYCKDRPACLTEGQEWAAKFDGSEGLIVTKAVTGGDPVKPGTEANPAPRAFDPHAATKAASHSGFSPRDMERPKQPFDPHASLKRAY